MGDLLIFPLITKGLVKTRSDGVPLRPQYPVFERDRETALQILMRRSIIPGAMRGNLSGCPCGMLTRAGRDVNHCTIVHTVKTCLGEKVSGEGLWLWKSEFKSKKSKMKTIIGGSILKYFRS